MNPDEPAANPDNTGFADLEAEGWTDLHLHPTDARWSPPLQRLPAIIESLGVQSVQLLTLHGVADCWDDEGDVPDPLLEEESFPLTDLPDKIQRDDIRHLTMVVDAAEAGCLPLLAACQNKDWHACIISIGWGLTTVPDVECKRTAARFHISLAVGGPGIPANYRQFARNAGRMPAVQEAVARLAQVLGVECTVTVTYGE
ncbi:MAG: hypothetical protein EA401_02430 [Planctomycetota bacterium]|nr:MAG: hypothetical protein EA401_02430 [Planctomycetota bacterium]